VHIDEDSAIEFGGGKKENWGWGREGERNWPDGRGLNNIAGVRYQKKKSLLGGWMSLPE
jgi:hypothetical protein